MTVRVFGIQDQKMKHIHWYMYTIVSVYSVILFGLLKLRSQENPDLHIHVHVYTREEGGQAQTFLSRVL